MAAREPLLILLDRAPGVQRHDEVGEPPVLRLPGAGEGEKLAPRVLGAEKGRDPAPDHPLPQCLGGHLEKHREAEGSQQRLRLGVEGGAASGRDHVAAATEPRGEIGQRRRLGFEKAVGPEARKDLPCRNPGAAASRARVERLQHLVGVVERAAPAAGEAPAEGALARVLHSQQHDPVEAAAHYFTFSARNFWQSSSMLRIWPRDMRNSLLPLR